MWKMETVQIHHVPCRVDLGLGRKGGRDQRPFRPASSRNPGRAAEVGDLGMAVTMPARLEPKGVVRSVQGRYPGRGLVETGD